MVCSGGCSGGQYDGHMVKHGERGDRVGGRALPHRALLVRAKTVG